MTTGRASVVVAEWSSQSACSRTSAFSLSSRTTARRTVHTLIGSYVAFRTSTRPTSRPRRWCSRSDADPSGAVTEEAILAAVYRWGCEELTALAGRKGPQHAQHLDPLSQPGQRRGDVRIAVSALEVEEEHVAAEPL